jgi:hypothetical protein
VEERSNRICELGSLLPANLPLFSRHLQLPIPLGVDLPLAPGEHVLCVM